MRSLFWTAAAATCTLLCWLPLGPTLGKTQGPGSGGAVLKSPFANGFASDRNAPGDNAPSEVQRLFQDQATRVGGQSIEPEFTQSPTSTKTTPQGEPKERVGIVIPKHGPDPNADIAVPVDRGPWMILVTSYVGEDAAKKSREMVSELRTQYRLDAVTFNHGRDKQIKEYQRVKEVLEKQREFFEKRNLPVPSKLRAKFHRYQEQYAVLIGDYKTSEQARSALQRVRILQPPDPNRVGHLLFTMFYKKKDKQKKVRADRVYVNPFTHAFIVRNPAANEETKRTDNQLDMTVLRRLNRSEPYSLLKCNKKVTLVVKQFFTPSALQQRSSKGTFLDNLGLGKSGASLDNAAQNAHNLAKLFREKANLDAYVLHTKFSSIVTVGGFDSKKDPRMDSVKHLLTTRLHVPRAMPMLVPR